MPSPVPRHPTGIKAAGRALSTAERHVVKKKKMFSREEKPVADGGGWRSEDRLDSGGPGRSAEPPGEVRRGPDPHPFRDCEFSPPAGRVFQLMNHLRVKRTSGKRDREAEGRSERVALSFPGLLRAGFISEIWETVAFQRTWSCSLSPPRHLVSCSCAVCHL